eukprot:scaffold24598_cov105-Isochrysis_galbana.AAC.1
MAGTYLSDCCQDTNSASLSRSSTSASNTYGEERVEAGEGCQAGPRARGRKRLECFQGTSARAPSRAGAPGAHRRELVAFRLDVPRHRNVDDSQPAGARLAPPLLHQLSLRHDAPRGGG